MKFSIAIFCCLLVAVYGQNTVIMYPEELFKYAMAKQVEINDLQTEIFDTITGLRVSLSNVLKQTSNLTLGDIETDVSKILDIDRPIRVKFIQQTTRDTECMNNLRYRLNYETEFTGFVSSNCLKTFNNLVSVVIDEAYKTVGLYDSELSQFELSVIEAFASRNVWLEQALIRSRFTDRFNEFKAKLAELKERIDGITLGMEEKIKTYSANLNVCYKNSQVNLAAALERLDSQFDTCTIFDNVVAV